MWTPSHGSTILENRLLLTLLVINNLYLIVSLSLGVVECANNPINEILFFPSLNTSLFPSVCTSVLSSLCIFYEIYPSFFTSISALSWSRFKWIRSLSLETPGVRQDETSLIVHTFTHTPSHLEAI